MKRLTLRQVARANLTMNKKAYVSLFLGILLAVFLATATSLCAWGTVRAHEEQMAERVGWMDMFLLDSDSPTDEQLRNCGFFSELGHATVIADVGETGVSAGYYDETGARLINRTLKEGRLPVKAGEMAAELSALIRLRLEKAEIGDTLTLDLQPAGGVSEQRTFTLVGILNEQSEYLDTYNDEPGMRLPSLLVSPEEKPFAVGRSIVHRVLTYAPLITYNQVNRNCPLDLAAAYAVSRESGTITYYDSGWERARRTVERIMIWAILGAALMLSTCVGITAAMESLLARKTQDIGMLRAIGATRRQIRRIYGAEAWVLSATALPVGLLLGILVTWIVTLISPKQVVFSLNPWLLLLILGLSVLCVFVASRLPLYRASRQMPMGVLRDTAMLRKVGSLRSRIPFAPARRIAGRRAALHPLRHLGATGMTALTLVSAMLLGELALGLHLNSTEDNYAFRLYGGLSSSMDAFTQVVSPEGDTSRGELRQISALDGVSGVSSYTSVCANMLMEEVPEYFRPYHYDQTYEDGSTAVNTVEVLDQTRGYPADWLFYSPEDLADAKARKDLDWRLAMNAECAEQADIIRARLGFTESIVPVNVCIVDLDPETLRDYVTDGSIDMEALDSGRQALVFAPAVCIKHYDKGSEITKWLYPREIRDADWDVVIRNDAFTAGTELDLLELARSEWYGSESLNPVPAGLYADSYEAQTNWNEYYRSVEAVRTKVSVGAVLSGPVTVHDTYLNGFTVILTEKGAKALGLQLPVPEYVNVYLSGGLSPAQEAELEGAIEQSCLRVGLGMENQLRITREYMNKKLRQILLFAGLILLFFAVSVFMQVSDASRRIRSDTRMIGTLRAVGADLKTLVGCYRLPVWICAALGLVIPVLFYGFCAVSGIRLFTVQHPFLLIPLLAVMASCIALACTAGIRSRLASVTRQPIVENIREL